MIGLLVRKQLREIFRAYFYDAKHGKGRSKGRVLLYFGFFILIMAGVLGGIFAFLATQLCEPLSSVQLGWLYFVIMGSIAVILGAFGSVFNTYSTLYLAKDNDFLFSLPIPVNAIMISRLLAVYLMGLMYSACVMVPALAVYWIQGHATVLSVLGGLLLLLDISIIDLVLSCLLGYVIARISLKLKNKGILSALVAVVGIALYYVVYFRFTSLIQDLLQNAQMIGARIQGSARIVYLFGAMGEGNVEGILLWTLGCLAALALTWFILHRSFLRVATSTGAVKKAVYREKAVQRRSVLHALISRELKHFTSSAGYLLNCGGLGILFLIAAGVALLWQGDRFFQGLSRLFSEPRPAVVLLGAILCMIGSMIDPAAPSISLEGKSLWLVQSLPVHLWQVLRAKGMTQLLVGGIPTLFAAVCGAVVLSRQPGISTPDILLFVLFQLLFQLLMACWSLFWGVLKPRLDWSSEIYPLKQSLPVFMAMIGGFVFTIAFGGLYFWVWINGWLSMTAYLAIACLVAAAASVALILWLKRRGTQRLAELH